MFLQNYDFEGVVLTDDFSVTEAYDFTPDADVRMKKADNEYGEGVLTEYYDPSIPEQFGFIQTHKPGNPLKNV